MKKLLLHIPLYFICFLPKNSGAFSPWEKYQQEMGCQQQLQQQKQMQQEQKKRLITIRPKRKKRAITRKKAIEPSLSSTTIQPPPIATTDTPAPPAPLPIAKVPGSPIHPPIHKPSFPPSISSPPIKRVPVINRPPVIVSPPNPSPPAVTYIKKGTRPPLPSQERSLQSPRRNNPELNRIKAKMSPEDFKKIRDLQVLSEPMNPVAWINDTSGQFFEVTFYAFPSRNKKCREYSIRFKGRNGEELRAQESCL
ncbi:MAG: hypothetical protein SD837_20745 [Candidatus Electrothrix scaldis]|nr:MAG: hypothetical protein SD837_20745 [Candidatus Electrothrix sp. GW3-3]